MAIGAEDREVVEARDGPTGGAGREAGAPVSRVLCTEAAARLVERLRARHGPVLFHQSGGCCDGSTPMCYPQGEFIVGDRDVRLGEIADAPFYISESQFGYWQHTQLLIDVVPGQGGMFSLDNGSGQRFHVRSRLYTDEEAARLEPPRHGPG